MGNRQEIHRNERALVLTLTAAAMSTILCAWLLLRIPSDTKNAFLFGLSKERLLMLAGFALLFLLNIILFTQKNSLHQFLVSDKKTSSVLPAAVWLTLFFVLLPDYRFGRNAAIYSRIKPYILWAFLTSFIFFLYRCYTRDRFGYLRETFSNLNQIRKSILIMLAILLTGVMFVELTGLGKTVESSLWNKNGIPLLFIQLYLAALIFFILNKTGIFQKIEKKHRFPHFLIIWAISAFVWSLAAYSSHFFAPGPYEPNQEYYPYSDAISYDIAAQSALNGWGFNQGRTILKPTLTYITFLTRLLAGNDYNRGMLLQSALFAILPAIIYLFGTAIGGTGCGYLAAAFSLLKEWNALNTYEVLTIHSRLTMSEFLTQILFAAFCYAMYRWLCRNGNESFFAVIAGGTLALGMYTRFNFIAFLPAAMLLLIIAFRSQFKKLLKPFFWFLFSICFTATPMLIRDTVKTGGPFTDLQYTITNVLLPQRFAGKKVTVEKETNIETTILTASPESDSVLNKTISVAELVSTDTIKIEKTPEPPKSVKTEVVPVTEKEDFNTSQITQNYQNNNSTKYLSVFSSMINHGIHNFISSALTLPMELRFDDLHHLYTNEEDGLWQDNWQGSFSIRQWIYIGLWLTAAAVSMGFLIYQNGIAGFSIFYFWIVYAFSIGFSRSSGGRYIVPCNWIPMLLLAFFLTLIAHKGSLRDPETQKVQSYTLIQKAFVTACFAAFFTSMVLFEELMPEKDTAVAVGDLSVIRERLSDKSDINWELIEEQIASGTMQLRHGIALYPRFYYYRKGEHSNYGALAQKDYSRMTYYGINFENNRRLQMEFMMPHTELIGNFPQDSIFRSLSCKTNNGYEDVLAVTIETPQGEIFTYVRDPLREFSCPVPEPVCISIENCY